MVKSPTPKWDPIGVDPQPHGCVIQLNSPFNTKKHAFQGPELSGSTFLEQFYERPMPLFGQALWVCMFPLFPNVLGGFAVTCLCHAQLSLNETWLQVEPKYQKWAPTFRLSISASTKHSECPFEIGSPGVRKTSAQVANGHFSPTRSYKLSASC